MEQATQKIAREQKIPALPICFRLTVERGPDTGRSQDMPDGGTVGTSQATTFRLTDPTVSRIHLSLHATAEGVRIENRSLTNGTWLNGVRIREAFAESGAAISIGSTTLRLSIEADVGEEPEMPAGFSKVLGRSRAMRYALRDLARVASSDASLLLEGETGTGKGLVARAVHDASPRRNKPFIDVIVRISFERTAVEQRNA